jgi:hypothetical protein
MDFKKQPSHATFLNGIIGAPFIYVLIVPIMFLDLFFEIYHQVCFRLYSMQMVNRGKYIKIDRHKLKYLNWFEKMNCIYCGYVNGVLQYTGQIAAETEKYWCGIKHKKDNKFKQPFHHKEFIEYGDEKTYKKL